LPVRSSRGGRNGTVAFDLSDIRGIPAFLNHIDPDRILHLAADARPAEVELRAEHSVRLNVHATEAIADWCASKRRTLVFTSTDQVFGGVGLGRPYSEDDDPAPTTAYGRTKRLGEAAVLAAGGLVARLGWVTNDTSNEACDFIQRSLVNLRQGARVRAAIDELRTPINASAAASHIIRLTLLDVRGVVHVAGDKHVTPHAMLRRIAVEQALDIQLIEPVSYRDLSPPGRPMDVRLNTSLLSQIVTRSPENSTMG
jgi:dTDP-4-dehydrorhamnose reductase